jgi:hypothetical protein
MRRPLIVTLLAGSLLVACSEQPTEPTTRPPAAGPSLDVGPAGCTLNTVLDQVKALYPRSVALDLIVAILKALPTNPQLRIQAAVRNSVYGIIDQVTKAYTAGKLAGGKSAATQAKLLQFISSLYCFVGLPAPNLPPGALDPNEGAVAVITPTSGNTLVRPASKHGGVFIPAGVSPITTIVTVSRLPDSPGPLFTSLDQYPQFYEINASPAVTFNSVVTAAVCLGDGFTLAQPRLAHNVGPLFGDVEVLPSVSAAGVVDCSDIPTTVVGSRFSVGSLFAAAFLPSELRAATVAVATAGVGGTTKKFSPFGTVDAQSNPGTVSVPDGGETQTFQVAGGAVSPAPAVVVRSKNGTPIANVPVTFAVGGSGGTVNGGPSFTVNTNASGIATAVNWVVGTATSDYTLTASAPTGVASGEVAPYRPAVAFSPAAQTFTATVAGVLNYGSTGYRYLLSTATDGPFPPAGFQTQGFDDSGWPLGAAGFGHDGGNGCTLNQAATNKTDWPASDGQSPSYILLRKRFASASVNGTVSVAVDNDVRVFVNGTEITATAKSNGDAVTLDASGFAPHEGCASQGSLTFTASNLNAAANLLVIEARDRSGSSYIDAAMTP